MMSNIWNPFLISENANILQELSSPCNIWKCDECNDKVCIS